MFVATVFASILLAQTPNNGSALPWVQNQMESTRARAILKVSSRQLRIVTQSVLPSGGVPAANVRMSPPPPPEVLEERRESEEALEYAWDVVRYGNVRQADDMVNNYIRQHPQSAGYFDDIEIQCDLLMKRYSDAYKLIVPNVGSNQNAQKNSPTLLLELSLASAGLGQVYAGQLGYCQSVLRQYYNDEYQTPFRGELSYSNDVKNVLLNSILALGMFNSWSKAAYLELALSIDPENVVAAREAVNYYEFQGRYTDLRRVSSAIAARLEPGLQRDFFTQKARGFEGVPDKPQGKVKRALPAP